MVTYQVLGRKQPWKRKLLKFPTHCRISNFNLLMQISPCLQHVAFCRNTFDVRSPLYLACVNIAVSQDHLGPSLCSSRDFIWYRTISHDNAGNSILPPRVSKPCGGNNLKFEAYSKKLIRDESLICRSHRRLTFLYEEESGKMFPRYSRKFWVWLCNFF